MVTVRVCLKVKTSRKSVVFTNKVGKNSQSFVGVFNKTIISLLLFGYEMIIANSYPTRIRGISVRSGWLDIGQIFFFFAFLLIKKKGQKRERPVSSYLSIARFVNI